MNVLWLCPYPYPGKNQHPAFWITEWADYLTKNCSIKIHAVSTSAHCQKRIEEFEFGNLKITFIKSPRGIIDLLTFYKRRISLLQKFFQQHQLNYDLVHVHGIENQFQASCFNSKIPVIISVQGIISKSYHLFKGSLKQNMNWYLTRFYEKKFINVTKNFFCRTQWDKEFIQESVKDANIIHNWEMIRQEFAQVNPELNSNRILFTGGTHPIKGLDIALKVFKQLREKGYELKLVIAGSCDEGELKKILKSNGMTKDDSDLEIVGFLNTEKLVNETSNAFCMLHPTLIDNSANSVCESQLAGLPVVASKVGGIVSLIENRRNGLIMDLDVNKITNGVIELINDKTLRDEISRNSKVDATKRHNPGEIARITKETYQSLLKMN